MSNHTIATPITTWAAARTTDREVLNRAEVATLLSLDPRTIDHGIADGTIPAVQGMRWRFQVSVPVDVARPGIGDRKHSRAGFTSYEAAEAELTLLRADLMRKVSQPLGRDFYAAYG